MGKKGRRTGTDYHTDSHDRSRWIEQRSKRFSSAARCPSHSVAIAAMTVHSH